MGKLFLELFVTSPNPKRMSQFVAFLRGINVGGNNKISMKELKPALEKAGLLDVETYIQSGNIAFKSVQTGIAGMEILIQNCIQENFGLEIPVMVVSDKYLRMIRDFVPADIETNFQPNKIFIMLLKEQPETDKVAALNEQDHSPEKLIIGDKYVILASPDGFSGSKLSTNFLERKLKVACTARNLKTIDKMLDLITA